MKPLMTGLWDASLKAASFDKTSHTTLAYGEIYHFCIGTCIIAENVHKWLLMCTVNVNSACRRFSSSFAHGLSTDQKKQVFVKYGQAKVAATARKELAVPRTNVFHVCCKSWPTKLIDEFRIDIYCYNCEERLKMGNEEDGKNNRGLLHCRSNACKSLCPLKKQRLECWEKYCTCDTKRTL